VRRLLRAPQNPEVMRNKALGAVEFSGMHTRIKICGITNCEDAEAAIGTGADALGFNTWPGTPRHLDLDQAADWLSALPPFVTKVALLVNASLAEARRIAQLPFIDALQLHGDENPAYCAALRDCGRPFIKALRLQTGDDLSHLSEFGTPYFLIDAHVAGAFGGTGVRADLALAAEFRRRYPRFSLVLAGGLRPENVAETIRELRPYAVDVSSGVEAKPGRKDLVLMRSFVAAVRAGERS
jgi:phosphoribosylanthranilate isomerase